MLKVSVIIPTRNNGNKISATLRNLFRQTIAPEHYEIIVVDNRSTDSTEEMLSHLKTEAVNLRWVKEPNTGRSHARNRGIIESSGDVVLFLDDDIQVEANHLESHLAYHAQSRNTVAVIGRVIDISPITPAWAEDYFHNRQVAGSSIGNRDMSGTPLGLFFATGNVSLLRSTLESIKMNQNGESLYFDPTFQVREDGDMGCRLIKRNVQFVFADDILCRHDHPRSWRSIVKRSYEGGYALVQLLEKHPEIQVIGKWKVTASTPMNYGLNVVSLGLFGPAYLLRSVWPQLMRKVIGARLAYQANRGYQQAFIDRIKIPKKY